MMFLIRAAFWLAVVSVFVPRDFAGEAIDLPFDQSTAQIDMAEPVSEFCQDRQTVCEAGEEALRLGGMLADFAVDRIETAIAEAEDNNS